MRLILIRHGETSHNKKKVNQGWLDIGLNTTGKKQSKKAGLRLKKEKIDFAYVSDLKRAVQTAKEIIKHHPNSEVIYTPKIRERNLGVYEGTPQGTMSKEIEKRGSTWDTFKPKKGESIKEVTRRADRFLKNIFSKHKDNTVLIVSHGSIIKRMLKIILNYDDKHHETYSHGNTAITILDIKKSRKHKVHALACTKHIKARKN